VVFGRIHAYSEAITATVNENRNTVRHISTPADAAIALRIAASGGWDANADVSGDGQVTSLDALMILQAQPAQSTYNL